MLAPADAARRGNPCSHRGDRLGKYYGDRAAVINLSFRVEPGSVTGFLGPNGSGKSTTMRLMLGLDNGDGRTTFDGIEFRAMKDPMRSVGALLEAKAFHPTRKARNHLRLLAAANNIPDTRVDEVMAMVGLNSVAGDNRRSSAWAWASGSASPLRCSATPTRWSSTSPRTGSTPRASPGCATS
jgi:ABC-type transport system involved in cytochrome bd biosynthesis fused ATPase/permease subunit